MNAGLNGLPGGALGQRRVVGLLRVQSATSALADPIAASRAINAGTFTAVADITNMRVIAEISGRGALLWGAVSGPSSGNMRVMVEVDGVSIYDVTAAQSAGAGQIFLGSGGVATAGVAFQYVQFSSSVRVWVATSVSGAGNPICYLNAEIHA